MNEVHPEILDAVHPEILDDERLFQHSEYGTRGSSRALYCLNKVCLKVL